MVLEPSRMPTASKKALELVKILGVAQFSQRTTTQKPLRNSMVGVEFGELTLPSRTALAQHPAVQARAAR